LRFCAGFTIGIWKAPFVFAKFPGSESTFAGSNALIVSMGGLLSTIIGGYISDSLANPKDQSQRRIARAWVPAVGSLLAAPLWAAFVLVDNPAYAAVCLFLEYIVAECWFGPTLAVLFNVVPKARRGAAQGLFSMLSAIGNIAPILVGTLAGGAYGNFPLGTVLIYAVSGSYLLSGLLFAGAAFLDEQKIAAEYEKKVL
jgi:MFS family permease